jgi:hypothetical protein
VAVQSVLALEPQVIAWSEAFARKENALFLGRGMHYPVALEGALKLKEISYIHAEAYPAGELKHGPLALVTSEMPVVAIAPNNALLEKLESNLHEVRARGGELFVFADAATRIQAGEGVQVIRMPEHYGMLSPILHVVPLQLLAYHTAVARGTDVDKPRNLAKSVTWSRDGRVGDRLARRVVVAQKGVEAAVERAAEHVPSAQRRRGGDAEQERARRRRRRPVPHDPAVAPIHGREPGGLLDEMRGSAAPTRHAGVDTLLADRRPLQHPAADVAAPEVAAAPGIEGRDEEQVARADIARAAVDHGARLDPRTPVRLAP